MLRVVWNEFLPNWHNLPFVVPDPGPGSSVFKMMCQFGWIYAKVNL